MVSAQPQQWEVIGRLSLDRHQAQARYIGNGKVMVIGGYGLSNGILSGLPTQSTEIIDVVQKRLYPGPAMNVERASFQIVDAPDGVLYAVGGINARGAVSAVERYDPVLNRWTVVGELIVPRWQQACVFVSEDEILVVAGFGRSTAELFNVRTGSSRLLPDFPYAANSLVTIQVPGRLPAFYGGRAGGPNSTVTSLAYAFDTTTNAWVEAYDFDIRTVRPTVITLENGKCLVVSGVQTESPFVTFNNIMLVDTNGDVTTIGSLIEGRQWHGLGLWRDGHVLCAGGTVDGATSTKTCELIDPTTGNVRPAPALNVEHSFMPMVTFVEDGRYHALVISGLNTESSSGDWKGTNVVEHLVEGCTPGQQPIDMQVFDTVDQASRTSQGIRLTPSEQFARGAVWATEKVDLTQPFTMLVGFRMTNGDDNGDLEEVPSDPGADGIALVIQQEGVDAVGQYGRGIGYDGIKRSIAVEFDTYHNAPVNDPNGNHVGVQSMGKAANSSKHAPPANLAFSSNVLPMKADGTTYYAYLEYINKQLKVYLNDRPSFRSPIIVRDIDIDSLIGLDSNGRAWVGITSATGRSMEQHEIVRWEINACPEDSPVSVIDRQPDARSPIAPFVIADGRVLRDDADPCVVDIVDVRGRVVWTTSTTAREIDLPTAIVANGQYIVSMRSITGTSMQRWLVMH